jgi:hypothetical protein
MILALARGNASALWTDRNTFGLLAVAGLVLAVATTLAAFSDLAVFRVVAFLLVPIFATSAAAVQVSGERASGYAAVLHTSPVTPAGYYAAKLLVALLWAFLAMALGLPFAVLLALHAGAGFLATLLPWIAAGFLLSAYSACLGLLISVLLGRRGLLPSAFGGIGAALALAMVPFFLGLLPDATREAAAPLARLSPLVDVLDPRMGLGLRDLGSWEGAVGYVTVASYAILFAGLGYAFYARLQNPEGWDAPRPRVRAAVLLGALLVLAPVLATGPDPLLQAHPSGSTPPPFETGRFTVDPEVRLLDAQGQPLHGAVLRPGEALPLELQVGGQATSNATLTDVRVRVFALSGANLRIDPTSFALDPWTPTPCGGGPIRSAGEPSSTGPPGGNPGCWELPPRTVAFTVTLLSLRNFRGDGFGGLVGVEVRSDQGSLTMFPAADVRAASVDYWWGNAFLVWGLALAPFAVAQVARERRLGRKVELRRVPRAPPT